jgi:hypothetical protein
MYNSTIKPNKDYKIPKVSAKRQAAIDAGEVPKYPVRKPLKKSVVPIKKSDKPIAKVSAKRKVLNVEYKKVRDEFLRVHSVCEVEGCKHTATEVHHRKGRIGNDLTNAENFMAVCRLHHIWIETNVWESKELGYSINRLT